MVGKGNKGPLLRLRLSLRLVYATYVQKRHDIRLALILGKYIVRAWRRTYLPSFPLNQIKIKIISGFECVLNFLQLLVLQISPPNIGDRDCIPSVLHT